MNLSEQFEGFMISGSLGGALGSDFDRAVSAGTKLTLSTCLSIIKHKNLSAELVAGDLKEYYSEGAPEDLDTPTRSALSGLEEGQDWHLTGASGPFAALNGASRRIAPLAFMGLPTSELLEICRITHRNEEACAGALALVSCITTITSGRWNGQGSLIDLIIDDAPDSAVKHRLMELSQLKNAGIEAAAKWGTSAFVVESVPFAIYAAGQIMHIGLLNMFDAIIASGGDTDSNAAMAGQIAGTLLGAEAIPPPLILRFKQMEEHSHILEIIQKMKPILSS